MAPAMVTIQATDIETALSQSQLEVADGQWPRFIMIQIKKLGRSVVVHSPQFF